MSCEARLKRNTLASATTTDGEGKPVSPTFMGETTSFELVGEGEFPAELERVNFGGLWLGGLWALFNGFARWVLAVIGAAFLIQNLVLISMQYLAFGPFTIEHFATLTGVSDSVIVWSAAALLGLYGDRLIWMQEQRRLARGGKAARVPVPAWKYMRSQRRWGIAGVVLASLGYIGALVSLVLRRSSSGDWFSLALSVVVPVGVFIIDRHRRSGREANKRFEPTP